MRRSYSVREALEGETPLRDESHLLHGGRGKEGKPSKGKLHSVMSLIYFTEGGGSVMSLIYFTEGVGALEGAGR